MICRIAATFAALNIMGAVESVRHQVQDVDFTWLKDYKFQYYGCFGNAVAISISELNDWSQPRGNDFLIVEMPVYIDTYVQVNLDQMKQFCDDIKAQCRYDDDIKCFESYSEDVECGEKNGFDIHDFLECTPISDSYFVAPHCAEEEAGYSSRIHLGVFEDIACVNQVSKDTFYQVMEYGLPYSSDYTIFANWIDCNERFTYFLQDDDEDGGGSVLKQCVELYRGSTKCSTDLDKGHPYYSVCAFLQEQYPNEVAEPVLPSNRDISSTKLSVWATKTSIWGIVTFSALLVGTAGFRFNLYRHRQSNFVTNIELQEYRLIHDSAEHEAPTVFVTEA